MKISEKKIENQVQFWSLIGPFLVLLAITVLLFKVSTHWVYPIVGLIGIPLCVKWKLKGMAAALCCLTIFSAISFPSLAIDERYWHVGMALAIAFSFIILTLSLEEVQDLIDKLQNESQSRLENFMHLDTKLKETETTWFKDIEKFEVKIKSLSQALSKVEEDKQTFYKLAQLSKDELIQLRNQHELLLQDLFYKKQQISQLNERLEESEITVQNFVNSDSEKQIQELSDEVSKEFREKERLKSQVDLISKEMEVNQQKTEIKYQQLHEKHSILEEAFALKAAEINLKQDEIYSLKLCVEDLEKKLDDIKFELQEIEKTVFENSSRLDLLPYATGNNRPIDSMYIQLREQFEEKSCILDQTRKELFCAQEELLKLS
ncbi:MAG: hypothetical protein Q8K60_01880, partial [Parachlamydiaceae bacterium]|nr:hypothetical protein [Parachlamydiaceae bacterium]